MIDLSIIIVNWNTKDLLAQCLQSVYDTIRSLDFEIIVVDNASADGSPEMVCERFPQVRLIKNRENVGFARANNQAIRESRGGYLLLLNSDTVVLPEALSQMVDFMDCHPDGGAIGPKLINPDGSFQASYADFPTLLTESLQAFGLAKWLYGPYYPSPPPRPDELARTVDWVAGACLMVRREVADAVGLLDEGYWMYTEETDWCYRIDQAGWNVYYLPESKIVHFGGASSSKRRPEMVAQLYRSKLHFFGKYRGFLQTTALKAVIVCASLTKAVLVTVPGWLPTRRRGRAREDARVSLLMMKAALQKDKLQ
jgi:GT2 family glycosyltransferase